MCYLYTRVTPSIHTHRDRIMECQNPKVCLKTHERWKTNQEKYLPIGDEEHEVFKKFVDKDDYQLKMKFHPDGEEIPHANRRMVERAFNQSDINIAVQFGWVIERNFSKDSQKHRLVILVYNQNKRPLHVIFEIVKENFWEIVTLYNPESKPYKWSEDFQERVCFCK